MEAKRAERKAGERRAEREERRSEREAEERRQETDKSHQFEMKRLEIQAESNNNGRAMSAIGKTPKRSVFQDDKDDLDADIQRFQRYARSCR